MNFHKWLPPVLLFCFSVLTEAGQLKLHADPKTDELSRRYLVADPAFPERGAKRIRNAVISWPTASGNFAAFFDGKRMPVPDLLEWRCPIYSFLKPDGTLNVALFEENIAVAKQSGVPDLQISMILSNNNDQIPGAESRNIDNFFSQWRDGRVPGKMISATGGRVENSADNSECRNNRFFYSYHDSGNTDYVREAVAAITSYFHSAPSGELISLWHFRFPGNNDWWYPIDADFFDYSPAALDAWRRSLMKKYGTLEQVNKRYGSNYADWQELRPPSPLYNRPDPSPAWQDFQEFRSRTLVELQRSLYREMRLHDPKRGLTGWMTTAVYSAARDGIVLDYAALLTRECPGMIMALTWFDFFDFPGELYGQLALQYDVPMAIEPGKNSMASYLRSWFNCLRFPVERINWLWLLPRDPDRMPWIKWVLNQRGVLEEVAAARLVQEPVAQMFSYSDVILSCSEKLWDRAPIAGQTALFRWLQENNWNLPIFTDYTTEIDLARYRAVILPETALIRPEMVEKLVAFTHSGGTLLLLGECGSYDLNDGRKSFPLATALGIPVESQSGEWRCEKGRVIRRGGVSSFSGTEAEELLRRLGCSRPLTADRPGIATFVKEKDGVSYLGFINTRDGAATVNFKFPSSAAEAVELISGKRIAVEEGSFSLSFDFQWEIRVLKWMP